MVTELRENLLTVEMKEKVEVDVEPERRVLVRELTYNVPLNLPPEHHAVLTTHRGSLSLLRIINFSCENSADVWINAGAFTHQMTMRANDPTPWVDVRDYGGVKLTITNLSPVDAVLRVMIVGT